MDRTKLIHVVALVRARTCIHEREHARYEQGRFMVGYGIWTRKNCTSLTVLPLAVAEEKRIRCRIGVTELAGLADETS